MSERIDLNYVYTAETECKGCNKCILKCPTKANRAYWENSKNIINIKSGYCISCGECISICDHGARSYSDDIDIFFEDLKKGKSISMVVAPAAHLNFERLPKVLGFLKSNGVKKIYDVSFGADICTWAYINYITQNNPKTVIAQPCPVVVSYIEKFHTDLIQYLSPVQSPVMCLGVYLKEYENVSDDLAFLSPCIGKKRECNDINTHGVLSYNVTFAKLQDYLEENDIDLDSYADAAFDIVEGSIGFAFPRPGGLSENVKLHLGNDVWTKQVEGIDKIEDYFEQLLNDLENETPVPLIIDALNCEHGCNLGTGTRKNADYNFIDYSINERKKTVTKTDSKELNDHFNKKLTLEDFLRSYTDKSATYKWEENVDLDPIFESLGKKSYEDRNTNCFSCGYGSCKDFAYAVATGDNHINNCHHFLLEKFVSLGTTDALTNVYNRYSYFELLKSLETSHPKLMGVIFIDINKLKETNDRYGHEAGDALIVRATDLIRSLFENSIYRVGGDEFVILEACRSQEAFIQKVQELKEKLKNDGTVLLSIGYHFSTSFSELDGSITEAEKMMYADKEEFYKTNNRYDRRRITDEIGKNTSKR